MRTLTPTKPRAATARTLTAKQEATVSRTIGQITPTPYWYWTCRQAYATGQAKATTDPAAELASRGIFPPGPGRVSPSAVHTPMQPCESRACTSRCRVDPPKGRRAGRHDSIERHKLYPHYAVAGEATSLSDVRVEGVDASGCAVSVTVQGRDRREVFAAARAAGVYPTRLQVLRRGRRRRLCDDCRLSLQEAIAGRERAKERRAADDAGELPERDVRGMPIEPEPELNPAQAAMERIRIYGDAPAEAKLQAEDEASLQAEIGRYLAAAGGTAAKLEVSFR